VSPSMLISEAAVTPKVLIKTNFEFLGLIWVLNLYSYLQMMQILIKTFNIFTIKTLFASSIQISY
jgi:hypothetical protein